MMHRTKAHLTMCWAVPLSIVISPIGILLIGILGYWEAVSEGLRDEYRWAKFCDDYEAKERAKAETIKVMKS